MKWSCPSVCQITNIPCYCYCIAIIYYYYCFCFSCRRPKISSQSYFAINFLSGRKRERETNNNNYCYWCYLHKHTHRNNHLFRCVCANIYLCSCRIIYYARLMRWHIPCHHSSHPKLNLANSVGVLYWPTTTLFLGSFFLAFSQYYGIYLFLFYRTFVDTISRQ